MFSNSELPISQRFVDLLHPSFGRVNSIRSIKDNHLPRSMAILSWSHAIVSFIVLIFMTITDQKPRPNQLKSHPGVHETNRSPETEFPQSASIAQWNDYF